MYCTPLHSKVNRYKDNAGYTIYKYPLVIEMKRHHDESAYNVVEKYINLQLETNNYRNTTSVPISLDHVMLFMSLSPEYKRICDNTIAAYNHLNDVFRNRSKMDDDIKELRCTYNNKKKKCKELAHQLSESGYIRENHLSYMDLSALAVEVHSAEVDLENALKARCEVRNDYLEAVVDDHIHWESQHKYAEVAYDILSCISAGLPSVDIRDVIATIIQPHMVAKLDKAIIAMLPSYDCGDNNSSQINVAECCAHVFRMHEITTRSI